MALQALALGLLTVLGVVRFWEICALALLLGLNSSFEVPTRQSFILEMVGRDSVRNAVSLNSVIVNAARAIGPAIAGVLIAVVGEGACFLINVGSFVAVIVSLLSMDTSLLLPSEPALRARGQLREGLAYVRRTPELALPLVMMAMIGTLTYEFPVSLPVLAKHTFGLGSAGYGFMTAAMGVGAATGGLVTAARGRTGLRAAVLAAARFGICVTAAALAPSIARADRARPRRRRQRQLRLGRQLDAAARCRPEHAGPRHVAVVGRVPGVDGDRRPDRRRHHRRCGRARRAPRRRRDVLRRRRRRCAVPATAAARRSDVSIDALVPLKRLDYAKTRLASVLDPATRVRVMRALLDHTLEQVKAAPSIAVGDARARRPSRRASIAAEHGVAHFDDRGLPWNDALAAAIAEAVTSDAVAIVSADLPLLTADDVERFVAALTERGAVIARATDAGTNGVAMQPARARCRRRSASRAAPRATRTLAEESGLTPVDRRHSRASRTTSTRRRTSRRPSAMRCRLRCVPC